MSADARVKSLIDRVLRLKEEQDTIAADIREIYAEAKSQGYNKTAMGEVVAYLRKVEKKGRAALDEKQADFDLYLNAYERASGTPLATHTHEAEIPPTDFLGPHSQEIDDGRPQPSSNASGAKCDGAQTIVGRADDRSGLSITQLEQQDASASQDRNEPISDREATVTNPNTRDPHLLEADDGQPRTQSPDACGVKCDGSQPIVGHGGEKPKHASAQSEQSVTHSNTTLATSPDASRKAGEGALLPLSPAVNPDDDVPDFLKRDIAPARQTAADFRPHCLRPDTCASSGLHHCYQCEKASQEMGGAAA
ncbi:MAG: DUF2312 domain-containing protein [Rhizobiaceae bacterium]|nr:DUF2312 domain-containing protein [Rhizobiaceae bacterium]